MHNSLLAALPRAAKLFAVAACVTLSGCDLITGSSSETYALASVNQQGLPAPFPDPYLSVGVFRVTAGTLTLHDDGTLSGSFRSVCAPVTTPGSTCQVDAPEERFEGSYSREEGWLELRGRNYPAEFTGDAVSVRVYIPAYMGYYPEYNVRFTR